jgi:hypothetical protein
MVERYSEVVVFSCIFALIIAIHHIEMISYIKFFSCHSVFPAAAHAVEVSCFCRLNILFLSFNVFDRFCVDMCWGVIPWT